MQMLGMAAFLAVIFAYGALTRGEPSILDGLRAQAAAQVSCPAIEGERG